MLNEGYILDGKYEIIKVLGMGGMGTVYLCKNTRLDTMWAIKEVKNDLKNGIHLSSEPNILKNLNHAGIPRIIDIFYEENNLYMVEDYIEGTTLKEYVKEKGSLDEENLCRITSDICNIITYLHDLKPPIIYRDIKPSNIMITPSNNVVLVDFGISKTYKVDKNEDTVNLGSNGYAAPEQYGFGQSCKQTDIYGIGMVIYFMAKGKVSTTALEPLMDENYDETVSNDLRKVIQKCVQVDIQDRYVSSEDLNNEIMKLLKNNVSEKTKILNTSNIETSKKTKIPKLKRSFVGLLALIVVIIAIVYFLNGYKKNDLKVNTNDKATVSDTTQTPVIDTTPQPVAPTPVQPVQKGKGKKGK